MSFIQNPGQTAQKSTTVWSTPTSDEQKKYFSKHASERRVFGIISAFLQGAHGLLAFASFSAIFAWAVQSAPALSFVIPFASVATIIALHMLFRTTWSTYWYDKLDADDKTDSPIWVPVAIMGLLLIVEVNGASMFLENQVKPVSKQGTEQVEQGYSEITKAIESDFAAETAQINSLFAEKTKAAAAPFERQIKSLSRKVNQGDSYAKSQTASLKAQRDRTLEPIMAAKTAAIEAAMAKKTARKDAEDTRRLSAVTMIDNHNAGEVSRYLSQTGKVNTYAWVLSVVLLTIISALLYRLVCINVKSGILPLRNYTVLDAHGSVLERLFTALSDAFNRRGLQLAVGIHRALSPKGAITSFDGTVVATPGSYNTPEGFFPSPPTPQATERRKTIAIDNPVANTLWSNGAASQNVRGSYMGNEALPEARKAPSPTEASEDKLLKNLAARIQGQVSRYDHAMKSGDQKGAEEALSYLNNPSGPIMTEAKRLGIQFGAINEDDEVVVWRVENPDHKVPLSMVSESALNAWGNPISAQDSENRFKSDLNLYKDEIRLITNGTLVGISYKKEDGTWSALGKSGVKSRYGIAMKNAEDENPSQKVLHSAGKWAYAWQLIEEATKPKEPELQAA